MDMINDLKDKSFWEALMIRVLKTWCQAFAGAIGGTATLLSDVDWAVALSTATLAAFLCLIWNIGAGLPEVKFKNYLEQLEELRPLPKVDDEEEEDDE